MYSTMNQDISGFETFVVTSSSFYHVVQSLFQKPLTVMQIQKSEGQLFDFLLKYKSSLCVFNNMLSSDIL